MTTSPTNDEVKELGRMIDSMTKPQADYILKKLQNRYSTIRTEKALDTLQNVTPGSRVIITQGIKPKYMTNMTGVVTGIFGDMIQVEWERPTQRIINRFGYRTKVPASCVQVMQ